MARRERDAGGSIRQMRSAEWGLARSTERMADLTGAKRKDARTEKTLFAFAVLFQRIAHFWQNFPNRLPNDK